MPLSWEALKQRKLVQWGVAYLAGAWLLLQVLSLLAQPFAWPNLVVRAAAVVLGIGFFAVLILAWYHGERGEQRVSGVELFMLAGILAIAGSAVAWVSGEPVPSLGGDATAAETASAGANSIAVLPFTNMSADKENEYFSDGMTEDVLTNLSKIGSLRVISRTSVMRYKGTGKSTPEIARELGVANVLEGSVRRVGNRVRITAQLIRAGKDEHLWADSYDRELTDVFAVQSEIAQQIATALQARLTGSERAQLDEKPTENLAAYDLFLRGRELHAQLLRDQNERAIRLFKRALELDPGFNLARAYLSNAYGSRVAQYGYGREWADSGVAQAERAIALQPELAEGHHALGFSLAQRGDSDRADEAFRKALQLDPSRASTMGSLATSAGARGDHVQQLQLLERAMRLDPAAFNLHNNVIGVKLAIGDLAGAEASLRVLAERFPELEDQRLQLSAVVALARGNGDEVMRLTKAAQAAPVTRDNIDARLATSVLFSGHAEEALPMLERALANGSVTRTGRPPLVALLGYLKWQSGDRTRADSLFAAAIDASRRGSQPLAGAEYLRASIAATRGQNEEALQRLDRAVRAGWDGWMTGRFNPMFNGLHGNPRYEALMAQVKGKLDRQRAEAKRLGL